MVLACVIASILVSDAQADGVRVVDPRDFSSPLDIISADNKIVRRRLEDALAEHPAIDHASVTAIPDPELGQRALARIYLRRGAGAPSLDEVRDFVAERLGRHQAPRELIVDTTE